MMENVAAEQAAFTVMKEASNGHDISNRYNSLTIDEQRQVFTEMKNLQSDPRLMTQFGNVQLFDSNLDGRMDDAHATTKDNVKRDVFNPNEQTRIKYNPDDVAKPLTQSQDTWQPYEQSNLGAEPPKNQAERTHPTRKTATDRVQQTGEEAMRRGGQVVVDEVFRGMRSHGRGPSTTDRIQDRLGREGLQGAQRVLRDVLRR